MATRSARAALLQAHRSRFSTYSRFQSGRIRVGSLASASNNLARKTIEAELSDKTKKYNDGLISNEEMKAFLEGMEKNSMLSLKERADVADKVRDFDVRIKVERLTAIYNNAPEGSLEKIQSAQTIANFYKERAASFAPNTPAQSDAFTKAGQWDATVVKQTDSLQRTARKQKRAQLFRAVANEVPGTEEEARQKAQAYVELANQARVDGDETEALNFETQAQNAVNDIPRIEERLAKQDTQQTRAQIIKDINTLADAYHDGVITAQQFADAIPELESRAVQIADTSIQLTLNRWADSLSKDVTKGVVRGTFRGLPVVVKRGKGSGTGGSGSQTDWDVEDFNYSDNIRLAKKMFDTGKWDGQKYVEVLTKALTERATQVEGRIKILEETARNNPNTKVILDGKKVRAADALERVYKEQEDLQPQIDAFEAGTFGVAMVPPSEFTKTGDVKQKGKMSSTFEIIDTRNLPADQYVQDTEGIYHKIQKRLRKLTAEDMANVVNFGTSSVYIDPVTNEQFKIKEDSSGNLLIETKKQYVSVYDPGSSKKIEFDLEPGAKTIDSYAEAERKHADKIRGDLAKAQKLKEQELLVKGVSGTPVLNESEPLSVAGAGQESAIQKFAKSQKGFKEIVIPGPKDKVTDAKIKTAEELALPGTEKPKVVAPVYKTAEELNLPADVRISTPPVNINRNEAQTVIEPDIKEPTLKLAGTPPATTIRPINGKLINIPGPTIPKIAPVTSVGPLQFFKNLATRIFSGGTPPTVQVPKNVKLNNKQQKGGLRIGQ